MRNAFYEHLASELDAIEAQGLTRNEQQITSPQSGPVALGDRQVANLCANNHLGLADHPEIIAASRATLDEYGFGMASVGGAAGGGGIAEGTGTGAARGAARAVVGQHGLFSRAAGRVRFRRAARRAPDQPDHAL